ncbi:ATP-binding protein [Lacimicrobium sp. SS2-24]|uniref:ATP-binding protein n=1 Tax=Lacimicrobium sp. SS2-24 TaxID=2005569 RepID=UPI000B4A6307|nr:ATP-binding protein [Lacimicrobium sp. SS2-24]
MLNFLKPRTLAQQLSLVMVSSLLLFFITFLVVDLLNQESLEDTAIGHQQLKRISSLLPLVSLLDSTQQTEFERSYSSCHEGYRFSQKPLNFNGELLPELALLISSELGVDKQRIQVQRANFTWSDFSYRDCQPELHFPMKGLVISIETDRGHWLNSEVHSHEWHLRESHNWLMWAWGAFTIIAIVSILFIRHFTRPLHDLQQAANKFAQGLSFLPVKEQGSPDLKETIASFNEMQKTVANAVKNRTTALAAISHDIRTPLTALKLKIALLDDEQIKVSLIKHIDRIEKITASGLDFLKGQHTAEVIKNVNLNALLQDECDSFAEIGMQIAFNTESYLVIACRPEALARAIRNLLENSFKYAESAVLTACVEGNHVRIELCDNGPGIPKDKLSQVLEPFERLSIARESDKGGFGLGLAVVKAIVEGHQGHFSLQNRTDRQGLISVIELPIKSL